MGDALAPWHIIVLLIVLVLLFGSRRLPGAAKSLGQSMHIFKQSVSGLNPDNDPNDPNNNASGYNPAGYNPPAYNQNSTVLPPAAPPAQPLPSTPDATQAQLQELQRQVQELQRQSATGSAEQQNQPF
jgi:sec-independent protein translocase protein TatA